MKNARAVSDHQPVAIDRMKLLVMKIFKLYALDSKSLAITAEQLNDIREFVQKSGILPTYSNNFGFIALEAAREEKIRLEDKAEALAWQWRDAYFAKNVVPEAHRQAVKRLFGNEPPKKPPHHRF